MSYVYIESEPGLWTVGFYDPNGKWVPSSDHNREVEASNRVIALNGGAAAPQLPPLVEKCPRCEGNGFIWSEAWKAFNDKYPDSEDFARAIERKEHPTEPEEVCCPRCRGACKVLTDAGKSIAEVVRLLKIQER